MLPCLDDAAESGDDVPDDPPSSSYGIHKCSHQSNVAIVDDANTTSEIDTKSTTITGIHDQYFAEKK